MKFSRLAPLVIFAITGASGCRAKAPGKYETHAINWVKLHVTIGGKEDRNPLPATQENIEEGNRHLPNTAWSVTDWMVRIRAFHLPRPSRHPFLLWPPLMCSLIPTAS